MANIAAHAHLDTSERVYSLATEVFACPSSGSLPDSTIGKLSPNIVMLLRLFHRRVCGCFSWYGFRYCYNLTN